MRAVGSRLERIERMEKVKRRGLRVLLFSFLASRWMESGSVVSRLGLGLGLRRTTKLA